MIKILHTLSVNELMNSYNPEQAGIHLDYGHRSMDYRIKCDNDGK